VLTAFFVPDYPMTVRTHYRNGKRENYYF